MCDLLYGFLVHCSCNLLMSFSCQSLKPNPILKKKIVTGDRLHKLHWIVQKQKTKLNEKRNSNGKLAVCKFSSTAFLKYTASCSLTYPWYPEYRMNLCLLGRTHLCQPYYYIANIAMLRQTYNVKDWCIMRFREAPETGWFPFDGVDGNGNIISK